MNETSRVSLNLTAADVSRFNDWLDDKCAKSGLDTTLAADIKLCLNEVLANLMSYGLEHTPQPLTVVELTLGPSSATAARIARAHRSGSSISAATKASSQPHTST